MAKGRRLLQEGETALVPSTLRQALQPRRGQPLSEFAYAGFADAERAHLDDLTLVATEARAEADLALGCYGGSASALRCGAGPADRPVWVRPRPAGVCSVRWSSTAVFMASAPVMAGVGLVGGLDVAVIGVPQCGWLGL